MGLVCRIVVIVKVKDSITVLTNVKDVQVVEGLLVSHVVGVGR